MNTEPPVFVLIYVHCTSLNSDSQSRKNLLAVKGKKDKRAWSPSQVIVQNISHYCATFLSSVNKKKKAFNGCIYFFVAVWTLKYMPDIWPWQNTYFLYRKLFVLVFDLISQDTISCTVKTCFSPKSVNIPYCICFIQIIS